MKANYFHSTQLFSVDGSDTTSLFKATYFNIVCNVSGCIPVSEWSDDQSVGVS